MDPVPTTVGCRASAAVSRSVGSAGHGAAAPPVGAPMRGSHREHGVDGPECQRGTRWPTGRRRSVTSSTRRSGIEASADACGDLAGDRCRCPALGLVVGELAAGCAAAELRAMIAHAAGCFGGGSYLTTV